MNRRNLIHTIVTGLLFVSTTVVSAAIADPDGDTQQLLAKTGFKGGLVVCLGIGETTLSETLGRATGTLVQVLDRSDAKVAEARERLLKENLYGKVTVNSLTGDRLPYADNLVRLIVANQADFVALDEIMRALCPNGALAVRAKDGWTVTIKARPNDIDDWTHFLHGSDNNAVANDKRVGPPRQLQWRDGIPWGRDHAAAPSMTSMVSDNGRVFAIMDYGPTVSKDLPDDWQLMARDAFSGVELWRRAMGKQWITGGFRGGQAVFARRLVAAESKVYVTLERGASVSVLDAATGQILRTLANTDKTEEILVDGGLLAIKKAGTLLALEAKSGQTIWEKPAQIASMSLTLVGGAIYGVDATSRALVVWDARKGDELWRHSLAAGAVVVCKDGVVLAGMAETPNRQAARELMAFDAKSGKVLWKAPFGWGFNTSGDILVVNGVVWMTEEDQKQSSHTGMAFTQGRDLKTGAVVKAIDTKGVFDLNLGVPHHRCYRNKATTQYLVVGRDGTDFIDVATGAIQVNRWTRGTCKYGVMPANGLLYAPPHACSCYPTSKLSGFLAFTAAPVGTPVADADRLRKGSAYQAGKPKVESQKSLSDWPTFRGDAERSGRCRGAVSAHLAPLWKADLGGDLTQPVCADGRLFISRKDTDQIVCLAADTGNQQWRFTAGAAVDSPPTYDCGGVLFGCRDGRVYRLRAEDGALEWTFLTAPRERLICSYGRLESAWPMHGGVLVVDGKAMVVAGHNSFLAGGLFYYQLDAASGEVLQQKAISDHDPLKPFRGNSWDMEGSLNDVLSSNGKNWFLRERQFNWDGASLTESATHLFSPAGFLDPSMHHRFYWVYAARYGAGVGAVGVTSRVPYGRIMSLDDHTVFGFRTVVHSFGRDQKGRGDLVLYARRKDVAAKSAGTKPLWEAPVPFSPNSMALADNVLFVAGRKGDIEESIESFKGQQGSSLWTVSLDNGAKLAEIPLDEPPVFDGLIAANGNVFLANTRGQVICWRGLK